MWFLALVVSFILGLFSSFQLFLCLFYGLPNSLKLLDKYAAFKRKYIIGIVIHTVIMVVVIILMTTVLKAVWWAILIGFILIPFIISLVQKNIAIREFQESLKEFESVNHLNKQVNAKESRDIDEDLSSIAEKIQWLYQGKMEYFSMAEIAMVAIDLIDFNKKLSPEKFVKAKNAFENFISKSEHREFQLIDLYQFSQKIEEIQKYFEELIKENIWVDGTIIKFE